MEGYGGILMKRTGSKSPWILLIFMLAGIVLGGFIGTLSEGVGGFQWLNYGQTFGFDQPIILNLGILVITFGLSIKITISSIIGMLLAAFIYRFV